MNTLLHLDIPFVNNEDIFSTEPIDELFLGNTTRTLESEVLLDISFIDTTSSHTIDAIIDLPLTNKSNEQVISPSSSTDITSPEGISHKEIQESLNEEISYEDKENRENEPTAFPCIKNIDTDSSLVLEQDRMQPQPHTIIPESTQNEQPLLLNGDILQCQNGEVPYSINTEDDILHIHTSVLDTELPPASIIHTDDKTHLSFIEEVQLANNELRKREQQEQEYLESKKIRKQA
ncbi:MAG: hypothetical protein K2M30_05685 [Desulfovibrionaceae bacterium]|nr:hypothetical protein [Desulfovibrionaceae bacterium]